MPRTNTRDTATPLIICGLLLILLSWLILWTAAQVESRVIKEENTSVAVEPGGADPRVLELGRHVAESFRKWDR